MLEVDGDRSGLEFDECYDKRKYGDEMKRVDVDNTEDLSLRELNVWDEAYIDEMPVWGKDDADERLPEDR
jgi:hypothetical protein